VFRSFFSRCAEGGFSGLIAWDGLRGLLVCITGRKCANLSAYYRRARRASAVEVPLAAETAGVEPGPEDIAALNDAKEEPLRDLEPRDREGVDQWLLGHQVPEIARAVDSSQRTVFHTVALV
jgi:hypothetical protein